MNWLGIDIKPALQKIDQTNLALTQIANSLKNIEKLLEQYANANSRTK